MPKSDDFEEREERVRKFLQERAKRAIDLRSKDREFHGLEREFLYHQAQMISDYVLTKDIKHPRDIGDTREKILQNFLSDSGYIPKKFAVSKRSVRVVSTSGHMSNEIDAAFYDPMECSTLMNRQDVYEVYPVECVYGVIQIKSTLTKKELLSGLKNISSFKKLQNTTKSPIKRLNSDPLKSNTGFGIIFAYSSNLKWLDIVSIINTHAESSERNHLPNAIFILDRGFFLFGDGSKAVFSNNDIETLNSPRVHGFPDRDGSCLFGLISILLSLLRTTVISPTTIENYYRLPLIAEEHSYCFVLGAMAEVSVCEKHGDYARKISTESLDKILQQCANAAPINWIKATDIAYGMPENEEAYRRQPGDVRIYNPENLELSQILISEKIVSNGGQQYQSLAFDTIDASGMRIFLPYYYSAREGLISTCPKCLKTPIKQNQLNKRSNIAKTKE